LLDKLGYTDEYLLEIILRNFDLRPGVIIRKLQLTRAIYKKTAFGGHFGRSEPEFTWE
jgi:S-adenosylmethionine synthetase